MLTRVLSILALIAATLGVAQNPAQAADKLKVAISQRGFWDSSFLEFAEKEEFLKAADLDVEFFYTEGGGQTLQIINSGSVDVAMSNGLLGTIGAYTKGAPIRVISAQMTGANELFWYVRADSKVRNLKEADGKSIAFSAPGSSSNLVLLSLLKQAGSKARPVGTGGLPGTLTQVMSGQVDIGWAAPPFGVKEMQEGKIRILIRGNEVPSLRGQTVRTIIVNADSLKTKRDAIMRFVEGYREAVDWMYADPQAIKMYAAKMKLDEKLIADSIREFHPKEAMQTDAMKDVEGIQRDAVKLKFIDAPLTKEQLAELIQIPPRKK